MFEDGFDNDEFIKETINRAKSGSSEEARDCLDNIVTAIYNKDINSPYFLYLAE